MLVDHGYDCTKGKLIHTAFSGGNVLFISEGEFHRHQRKLIAPAFQPRHIAGYAGSIVSYAERQQQSWSDGTVLDLNQQMISLTLKVYPKTTNLAKMS